MKILLFICTFVFTAIKALSDNPDTVYVNRIYDRAWEYIESGDNGKAIPLLEEIVEIKKGSAVDFNPPYYKLYNILGAMHHSFGHFQTALNYYNRSLESTDKPDEKASMFVNIGVICRIFGEYAKAINYYTYALALLEKSKNPSEKDVVIVYHNLGFAYYNAGQWEKSLRYYLKSLQFANDYDIKDIGDTYYNTGLACQRLGRYSEANQYYLQSIKSYTNEYGQGHYKTAMSYINYAQYLFALKEYSKSWEYYTKAYRVLSQTVGIKHSFTSTCLINMGDYCYSRKNYRSALSYYQKSLIAQVYPFSDTSIAANPSSDVFPDINLIDILKAKARALKAYSDRQGGSNYLLAALETYQLAADYIEKLRTGYLYESSKLLLSAQEHEVFTAIVAIAYQLYGQTGDERYKALAFEFAERGKYGVLRQLQNENLARGSANVPDSVTSKELRIRERIGSLQYMVGEESKLEHPNADRLKELNAELFGMVRESDRLTEDIKVRFPVYYRQKFESKTVSPEEIQRQLLEQEVVLEYTLVDSTLYTFTITRNDFRLSSQRLDSTFFSSLKFYKRFLHSLYSLDYDTYRRSSYTLYSVMVKPFEQHLSGKNLIIIPDESTSSIAFESLAYEPYQEKDMVDYSTEPYLIRRYPISYALSSTMLVNSLSTGDWKWIPGFTGFAPSYTPSDSLDNLPLGVKSIRGIAKLLLGKAYTEKRATEGTFKQNCSNNILQIYAHGSEDTLNPSLSKIYMAKDTGEHEDGLLYAYEVNSMDIRTDLTVLVSCYSGSGAVSSGEGVLSIARSFILSGSRSVITSLWGAYYEPSIEQLTIFYRSLIMGDRKDEALQKAKLEYLKRSSSLDSNPRCWASLVIMGNPRAMYSFYLLKVFAIPILFIVLILAIILPVAKQRRKR